MMAYLNEFREAQVALVFPTLFVDVNRQTVGISPVRLSLSSGEFKLNIDAAYCHDSMRVGMGAVIRDSNGSVVLATAECIPNGVLALEVEALAHLFGLKVVHQMAVLILLVETNA